MWERIEFIVQENSTDLGGGVLLMLWASGREWLHYRLFHFTGRCQVQEIAFDNHVCSFD